MKELMIHIERIVRPLPAFQTRKLRMRRELLAHLLAALEEERPRSPDETTAIAQAKLRLGDPETLSRQLNGAIPDLERLMCSRVPVFEWLDSPAFVDRFGTDALNRLNVLGNAILAMVSTYTCLVGVAAFAFSAWFAVNPTALACLTDLGPVARTITGFWCVIIWVSWFGMSTWFSPVVVMPQRPWRAKYALGYLAAAVGLLTMWMLTAAFITSHSPTALDFGKTIATALAALSLLAFMGRLVASLPRPYEQWLTLDIAP